MLSSTACSDYSGKSCLAGINLFLLLISFLICTLTTFAQWTQIGDPLTGLTGGYPRISVVDSNIVWVAGGTGTSPKVYRTVDGGLNWVSLPTTGLPYFLSAVAAKDSLTAFVADLGGPNYTGGNAKLFKTTNAGLNWILIDSSGGTTGYYNDIQFSKSNPDFGIAICDPANGPGGPYIVNKTTDGGVTWVKTNPPGLPNSFSLWFVSYPIDPMFYGFAVVDITVILMTSYTTSDGGMTWVLGDITVPLTIGGDIVFNDDKQHGVMLGGEWPNIKVTSNGGNNWISVNTGTDIYDFCTASWVSGTNTVFICASSSPSNNKIIRSDDNGLIWQQQGTPNLYILELDITRYGNQFVGFAITSEGYVLKSRQDVSIIPVELISFTAITQLGKVILNWSTATEINNLGFEIERKIINNNDNGEWVLVGFREGYGTTTEPREYSYIDEISGIKANSFSYRLKQIDFNGSYEYSDEVLVTNPAQIVFALNQNYPNPFNPSTKIRFTIPDIGLTILKVHDILGRELATLVNEEKPAGNYTVEFNATNLPSGVYFYQLRAGSFVETKKMILMK